ncbi:MAG: alpha/beta hydrolase [Candidatus Latescibacteria bacterium]|nr:alpha/beta hydrolase [Candidatus Latescibacterota bacterium]
MSDFTSLRLAPAPATRNAWEDQRPALLKAMQQVMGPLPGPEKRCPLQVLQDEEVDCGSYARRLITYLAEPGCRVPAYLLVPHNAHAAPVPAVLCPHPTDNRSGHKVVVGLGGRENRAYASELAEAGFVTLAPSYPLLADYHPDWRSLGYQSGTMKAIWDNIRGLDLLQQLPFAQAAPFAAIGHSLGGHNSVYTAVFDQRIGVVVSSCGLDSYQDYKDGDITGWTSDRYMPRLKEYALADIPFDFHDMIAALAPRPCLISAPWGDSNFKWKSVDAVARAARAIYELYGMPAALEVIHPDCAHDFPEAARRQAYHIIAQTLRQ